MIHSQIQMKFPGLKGFGVKEVNFLLKLYNRISKYFMSKIRTVYVTFLRYL